MCLCFLSLREASVSQDRKKEKVLAQLKDVSVAISRIKLIRKSHDLLTALALTELFKSEFGQLYMLRYFSSPQIIWVALGCICFTWSLGSLIAHRSEQG